MYFFDFYEISHVYNFTSKVIQSHFITGPNTPNRKRLKTSSNKISNGLATESQKAETRSPQNQTIFIYSPNALENFISMANVVASVRMIFTQCLGKELECIHNYELIVKQPKAMIGICEDQRSALKQYNQKLWFTDHISKRLLEKDYQ